MPILRSPIHWFGGKGNMVAKLLPLVEAWPHRRYCEPFGGGASVLLAKQPVEVETYNDLDGALVEFFKILADPDRFEQFYRRVALLPYSRALYYECRATWQTEPDPLQRVVKWFVVARQSFGGDFANSWGSIITASRRGMAHTAANWLSCLERLPAIHQRLQRVQIECADFRRIIPRYDTPETLFYCDPPYVRGTRKQNAYSYEMTDRDHMDLVRLLLQIQGAAVLSGYPTALYRPLEEAGWKTISWQTACHVAGRTRHTKILGDGAASLLQPRIECVWLHPKVAQALEDRKNRNGNGRDSLCLLTSSNTG